MKAAQQKEVNLLFLQLKLDYLYVTCSKVRRATTAQTLIAQCRANLMRMRAKVKFYK